MFGLDLGEFIIIAVLAVVLLKPEDLPKVVRKIGVTIGKLRAYWNSVSIDLSREMNEIESLADPLEDGGKKTESAKKMDSGKRTNGENTLKKDRGKEKKRV